MDRLFVLVIMVLLLAAMVRRIYYKSFLEKRNSRYIYGKVNGVKARKDTKDGCVQFVLWKAGEMGYESDFWHNFEPSHWQYFKEDNL